MKTTIYYFSGTGNSLWLAREIARGLPEAELIPITRAMSVLREQSATGIEAPSERVGIVFPVYAWGVPRIVASFISNLSAAGIKYCFAVATCGGNPAATLVQTKRLLGGRGVRLMAGFSVRMPSNYIIWHGAQSAEEQQKVMAKARVKIEKILGVVRDNREYGVDKDFFLVNLLCSLMYRVFIANVSGTSRNYRSDEKCTNCGVCARVCPTGNISMAGDGPVWSEDCEQCLACLQWCPAEAVQYKQGTEGRRRYRHPDVKVSDMYCR